MTKIILDTNAYTAFLSGDEQILNELEKARIVYLSVIVLGELYAGFKGGSKEKENNQILERFIQKPTVQIINLTEETAQIFGKIKNDLKKAGNPVPVNDIWIAANCIETGAMLITYDKHFKKIESVRLWDF